MRKKGKKLLFVLLLFALIPSAYSSKAVPATERKSIVGVQIPLIEAKTLKEFDREISFLKELGFNTIIVRVFQNNGDRTHRIARSRIK